MCLLWLSVLLTIRVYFTLFTAFIKHIFYGDSLFGCLKIYSSQLVLISTAFYKLPFWH